jgi:hypothetical protein
MVFSSENSLNSNKVINNESSSTVESSCGEIIEETFPRVHCIPAEDLLPQRKE